MTRRQRAANHEPRSTPRKESRVHPIRSAIVAFCLAQLLLFSPDASAQQSPGAPFITEAYYRVKWGHFDEFMELFKKNHYPILKRMQDLGHIESMSASFPLNHASEDSRWDFRMTIVIPDTNAFALAFEGVSKQLYPDRDKLKKAEDHRFSLLLAHTDVVIRMDDITKW
jgi:hypothetical protein